MKKRYEITMKDEYDVEDFGFSLILTKKDLKELMMAIGAFIRLDDTFQEIDLSDKQSITIQSIKEN